MSGGLVAGVTPVVCFMREFMVLGGMHTYLECFRLLG